jgi:UDP-N-acetyl-D-mannosaminuronic acid dehydrogenase
VIAEELLEREIKEIWMTDPYVRGDDIEFKLSPLEKAVNGVDAVVLVTDHPEYGSLSPETVAGRMQGDVIVDTRAMLDRNRWERVGFNMYQV